MNRRLLVVTDNRFWLNRIGSNVRTLTLLQHLRSQGWAVSVAFLGCRYAHDADDLAALSMPVSFSLGTAVESVPVEAVSATSIGRTTFRQRVKRVRNLVRACATQWERPRPPGGLRGLVRELSLRARSHTISDYEDIRHRACVESRLQEDHPEWILINFVKWAWLHTAVPASCSTGVRWALDTHDVQHERQARFHALGEVHGLDISRREESHWLAKFDLVIAIQARDAALLRQMAPGSNVVCAMHPQTIIARSAASAASDQVTVGFLGSDMTPNTLAARELVERIWPSVLAASGVKARLILAGRVCEQLCGTPLPAGVSLLGQVADLTAFYAELDVVACPIRMGGGLKIKNVEALCRGKALVTTGIGAEGLENGAGTAYLLAEDGAEFVDIIVRLIANGELRERLSAAALNYAQTHFTPGVAFAELMAALEAPRDMHTPINDRGGTLAEN